MNSVINFKNHIVSKEPGYENISEKIKKAEQVKLYKAKEIKEKKNYRCQTSNNKFAEF